MPQELEQEGTLRRVEATTAGNGKIIFTVYTEDIPGLLRLLLDYGYSVEI